MEAAIKLMYFLMMFCYLNSYINQILRKGQHMYAKMTLVSKVYIY